MYLALSDEQEFLTEAAVGALSRHDTIAAAREALDGRPAGSYPDLWPVACEAGWPGLLSAESVDGAGLGAYEAMLVLEACGASLADAGLLGHLAAVALIEAAAHPDHELRRALASGEQRAALVNPGPGSPGSAATHVLDATRAGVLVVVEAAGARILFADAPGVTVTPVAGYDATRSLARVTLPDAHGEPLAIVPERVRDGRDLQLGLLAAESVGAAAAALRMARDYAVDRHAFGRAIGSYQAIKHKLVEMLRRTELARSLLVASGRAWSEDRPEFGLYAAAARVAAAEALDYAAPENIFIHGGIGATWEHDAQLLYRRAELSRRLAGGTEAAAEAVGARLLARQLSD